MKRVIFFVLLFIVGVTALAHVLIVINAMFVMDVGPSVDAGPPVVYNIVSDVEEPPPISEIIVRNGKILDELAELHFRSQRIIQLSIAVDHFVDEHGKDGDVILCPICRNTPEPEEVVLIESVDYPETVKQLDDDFRRIELSIGSLKSSMGNRIDWLERTVEKLRKKAEINESK